MAASPTPSPARRLRRELLRAALLAVLALGAAWAWRHPWAQRLRVGWELARAPAPTALHIPVEGVDPRRVAATFGAPRGRDRQHAGVDIFAKRGTPVVAATRGIVVAIAERGLGGRQVWVLGPARQRHYYAHLEAWAPGLQVGDLVEPGDPLGAVGDSGNARGTPPHLHYGIYAEGGAYDPLPLLRAAR
ncbi:peptidase [Xanthomonas sp. NCPPB 1128]|uniref:M23 family metallopeptidase n=1 Tax=Xanthomonas sp. NCPPB 1128 TaxID=1775876 RepID=UPI00065A95A2|nr:M23 family metallopeptidase [Xanthomonas sp. NCPPB 1128]KMM76837.1 peptidase [Xanthomonas sp. NCPPB 1128]